MAEVWCQCGEPFDEALAVDGLCPPCAEYVKLESELSAVKAELKTARATSSAWKGKAWAEFRLRREEIAELFARKAALSRPSPQATPKPEGARPGVCGACVDGDTSPDGHVCQKPQATPRHQWVMVEGHAYYGACSACGVMRRADDANKPCPGKAPNISVKEPQATAGEECEGIKRGLRCSACVAADRPCEKPPAREGDDG